MNRETEPSLIQESAKAMPAAPGILSTEARHVLISVNPHAGSGSQSRRSQVAQLAERLSQDGFRAEVIADVDQLSDRAAELHESGRLRVVVGAGGDGTMHVLLNRLAVGIPLAMLPLGTENLLAKYLCQQRGVEPLARMIAAGQTACLDAGRANDRLFLLMASAGFDADVARRLHESRSGNIRHWHYVSHILAAARKYDYPQLRITLQSGDDSHAIDACWCFAFNIPQYGFGLKFAPEADARDGLLDVCTFRQGSWWNAMRYSMHLWLQRHERLADCTKNKADRVRIEAPSPVPYQLDGDPGGWLPLELGIVPQRLTLLVQAEPVPG